MSLHPMRPCTNSHPPTVRITAALAIATSQRLGHSGRDQGRHRSAAGGALLLRLNDGPHVPRSHIAHQVVVSRRPVLDVLGGIRLLLFAIKEAGEPGKEGGGEGGVGASAHMILNRTNTSREPGQEGTFSRVTKSAERRRDRQGQGGNQGAHVKNCLHPLRLSLRPKG